MYDVIIIGAGPAGITSGLYIKRANLNPLIIYNDKSSLEKTEKIENYYGFEKGIDDAMVGRSGYRILHSSYIAYVRHRQGTALCSRIHRCQST